MFTERHCITLLVLAGVGCAKAVSGDDLADELPGSAQSPAAGGSGPAAAGTGPTTAAGGTSASAAGGGFGSGATGTTGGGAPSSVACASPRMPSMAGAMQGNSGSFETTDAVCYFVEGSFNNWACSNLGGRSVTVNGTSVTCGGALPAQADGGYYFEFSASTDGTDYTSFYWYTS
jgi:hypothetical protein